MTERPTWGGKFEFLLSCIGYAVSTGNIWRFPYLCMRNGGGAFLIPYTISIFLCGIPLFFMEVCIGQFSSRSPAQIWNMCPLFKGLGWGVLILSSSVIFYNIIFTWVLYFLYESFTRQLPWASCDNAWNTPQCIDLTNNNTSSLVDRNNSVMNDVIPVSPGEEYFERKVLEMSSGIDDFCGIKWDMFGFFILSWLILFCCLFKGVKTSGKVVYVTATLPYVLLTVVLIRGVNLPGATIGIKYFLMPDFEKLFEIKVWAEAFLQSFFSLGPAWGGIITMASYNHFNNNLYREILIVPLVNAGTSIFGGIVIFSIVGFMSEQTGLHVDQVITSGPGLAFIAYPEALAKLPVAPIWAVLFFLTLVTLQIDSAFGMLETVITGLEDTFPKLRKFKVPYTACLLFAMCVLGLPVTTRGGMYVLQLLDWYLSCISLYVIALCECLVVAWIYGHERFYYDIEFMLKRRPSIWWKICLGWITPTIIVALLIYCLTSMQEPYYGTYTYPEFAIMFGWCVAWLPLLPLPIGFVHALWKEKGTLLKRIKHALRPSNSWGPSREKDRFQYKYAAEYVADIKLLKDTECINESKCATA